MFAKRHYVKFAAEIHGIRHYAQAYAALFCAIHVFREDSRFDERRFIAACGFDPDNYDDMANRFAK